MRRQVLVLEFTESRQKDPPFSYSGRIKLPTLSRKSQILDVDLKKIDII